MAFPLVLRNQKDRTLAAFILFLGGSPPGTCGGPQRIALFQWSRFLKIAYLVHDLSDPAVHRRVRMLKVGSGQIKVAGFTRVAAPPKQIEGCEAINLGLTRDGQLLERIGSVAVAALRLERLKEVLGGCQLVLARNLEMLFLASAARKRYAADAALVFECLDIHRLLLRETYLGRLLRRTESRLVSGADLIMTSSPRFISEYFKPRNLAAPIKIIENKILLPDYGSGRPERPLRRNGRPWKIGWFGMIRCRRSFDILSSVARRCGGDLQVVIAGRPSAKEFPDFEGLVARSPHVTFTGSYRFDELPALYNSVDFCWAVDYFEKGLNSSWLLPNRIYESAFFGAVPIAVEGVETARWLAEKHIGLTLNGEPEAALRTVITAMTDEYYQELSDALKRIPTTELADTVDSCRQLIEDLAELNTSSPWGQ
jgi:succinoglycan biosynthesis protein ExoL